MIEVVYAMGSETVALPSGEGVPVIKGSHWPVADPVVRARPGLFSPDARWGLFYSPSSPPPGYDAELNEVEEATANPGEKRSARRG
jgi:hypothetical protein